MKRLVLSVLLGLCSLVFAQNTFDNVETHNINPAQFNKVSNRQIECLAKNMYFEAKNEPTVGIQAVGYVTLNRVADSRFPRTICDVVYQRVDNVCQFSWVCLHGKNPPITDNRKYKEIYKMADTLANATHLKYIKKTDPTKGSLYFHATYVNPGWNLKKKATIGGHVFYSGNK